MDEKQRQSQLDKLRQQQAANEDAYDQIAIAIARADIPISQDPAGKAAPDERAATPADWIDNYAEGMTRAGKCSHEEAVTGIRTAFENRYGMSPEAYADRHTPQQVIADKQLIPDHDLPAPIAKEAREALSAAGRAFDDLALKRTLPLLPYAESARDLIMEAEGNPVGYVEMVSGPNLEYSWFAKVTRDPTPQGLDGGRVRFFDLIKSNDATTTEAPDLRQSEKYEEWLKDSPDRNIHIARYRDGKLTRHVDDPQIDALIAEIKKTCADWEIDRTATSRPSIHHALSKVENALNRMALEQPLSLEAARARDLCGNALARIEQSRDDNHGREAGAGKDAAIARAIEKVKNKEEDERQRGERDQGHGRDR